MNNTATEALPNRYDANASFWVRIIREHRDKYRNELTDPAMLHAIGDPTGMAVLDAGCGEGYLSRILAKKGANATGIDSSNKLIEAARRQNLTDGIPVSFDIASVDDLPYPDSAFDLVVCNHLVNDLFDPSNPISEFARVLHSSGRLIILMLHPCFYNKHAERDQATNGMIASSYFDIRSVEQTFQVDGLTSPQPTLRGFVLWSSTPRSCASLASRSPASPSHTHHQNNVRADSWWRKGFTRPLFMLLTAQKLSS